MARKEKRIATIDAETDPFKYGRKPEPFCWGFFDGESYVNWWGDDSTEQMIDYLKDETDLIIYAHNGGKFDFFYLLPYLDPDLFIINGRIAKATLFDGAVEIRDSWLILPIPLAENEKLEIDYNKFEKENREKHKAEILKYLQVDCRSLWNWVTDFRREFGGGLTLAGAAFKQLRKTDYQTCNTFDEYDTQFRHFYFGGRVQCFEVGAFKGDFEYVDINSAYPYAMTFPHWSGNQVLETYQLPDGENGSWFAEITARSKGALPFKGHDGKLYFPDDNEPRKFMATGWEILAGIETNTLTVEKIHIVYKPLFKQDFTQYVDKFFAMKREAEINEDKTRRQFAKLMLNSCYGKFGQDGRDFEKFSICEFGDYPDEKFEWTPYADYESGHRVYSRPDPVNRFYNVATAASITGFVRAYLWKAINDSEKPLYCDTDSIICRRFNGVKGKALGEWDLEAEAIEAYIAQRKMYALKLNNGKTKTASKGVKLSYDQIKQGVEEKQTLVSEREAPAFSLKYGARFFNRSTYFENIEKNTLTTPPEI